MNFETNGEVLSQPVWRKLIDPAEIAAALCDVYRGRGAGSYDEIVSQNEHALQAGALAMAAGVDDRTVSAAFLHDIGHLLLNEHRDVRDDSFEDRHHENVAARFLANWFDESVTTPIRLHVPAKRYLCAVELGYFDALSEGSVRSLAVQGGPMTKDQITEFENVDYFDRAVDLRRWDDLAKVSGAVTPGIDVFESMIADVVANSDPGEERN